MRYIDLNKLSDKDLHGEWEIYDWSSAREKNSSIFLAIHTVAFLPSGELKLRNGFETNGRWRLERQSDLIYNPQIKFFIGEHDVQKSIITRLYSVMENDCPVSKLTLYFSTGLELILKKSFVPGKVRL